MNHFFCGICQRVKVDGEWLEPQSPRDATLLWTSTYCRYCLMEMTFSKNKQFCEKLNLRLIDIMKELHTIPSHNSVEEAAIQMKEKKRGVIGVTSEGSLTGILTDKDFTQKIVAQNLIPCEVCIKDVMSYPVITISKKASIPEAALKMALEGMRHLVVEHEKNVWKVVSAQSISESMQTILAQTYALE